MSNTPIFTAIPKDLVPKATDVEAYPTHSQPVSLTAFAIQSQKASDPDDETQWENEGYLYQGTKTVGGTVQQGNIVNGVNFQAAFYAQYINDGPGPQVDISQSIVAKAVAGQDTSIELVKAKTPLTDWTFDIIITNFAKTNAAFTGTMVKPDGSTWNLKGSYLGLSPQSVPVTVLPPTMQHPPSVHGTSPHDLDMLSPIVLVDDGDVKAGQDGAQIRGNQIMNKLIMHSLAGTKAEDLIGVIDPTLDQHEAAAYTANLEFFKRAGIHMLCDYMKENKTGSIPTKITDHILWKNSVYMQMCSQPSPPPSANKNKKKLRSIWDPSRMYGLNPDANPKDAQLLSTLQKQFQDATMKCYAIGYREQCKQWQYYEQDAEAWFRFYAWHCTTSEFLQRQATLSANAAGVNGWGPTTARDIVNKLTLLKFAAIANNNGQDIPDLNIESVVDKLDAANNEFMAYSMYIDEDVAKSLDTFLGNPKKDDAISKGLKDEMNKMGDEVIDNAGKLQITAASAVSLIIKQGPGIGQDLFKWWKDRSAAKAELKRITFGQAAEGIEMVNLSQRDVPGDVPELVGQGEAVDAINNEGRGFLRTLAEGGLKAMKGIKYVLGIGIHVAAIYSLYKIVSGLGSKVTPEELGFAVCTLATAGLYAVRKLVNVVGDVGKALKWGFTEGQVYKAARSWFIDVVKPSFVEPLSFTKVGKAFVGDFTKLARTLGLIGCVFNLIMAFEAMGSTGANPDDPVAARERVWAKVNLALAGVETAACVGEIAAEIAGFEMIGAACGAIGLLVGVAALVVSLVQMFESPPDVWQPVEDWLAAGDPTTYWSYDGNNTYTGAEIITFPLPMISLWPNVSVDQQANQPDDNKSGNKGNQNQDKDDKKNNNQNNDNNNNNGNSKSGPDNSSKEKARRISPDEDTAARNLSAAFQIFIDTAREFDPGSPTIAVVGAYQAAIDHYVREGLLFAVAVREVTTAWTTYDTAYRALFQANRWDVQYVNPNNPNGAVVVDPFDQIWDDINAAAEVFDAKMES